MLPTEVLWCASIRRQHQIPQPGLRVGIDVIVPPDSVRDLGLYLDCDVGMRTCLKGGVQLFRGVAATPQHLFIGYEVSLCVARRVIGFVSP